jgi:hypothetical protein
MALSSAATLDDLKQLEITCYVPSYLTKGLRLHNVEVTYDEIQQNENQNHPLPLYSIQYGNGWSATFTIESAREGIGDRNLMSDEENAEETEIKSPFGPMDLIYRPKGKDGRKDKIIANWVSDPNMNKEKAKRPGLASRPRPVPWIFCDRNYISRVHQDHSITSPDRQ